MLRAQHYDRSAVGGSVLVIPLLLLSLLHRSFLFRYMLVQLVSVDALRVDGIIAGDQVLIVSVLSLQEFCLVLPCGLRQLFILCSLGLNILQLGGRLQERGLQGLMSHQSAQYIIIGFNKSKIHLLQVLARLLISHIDSSLSSASALQACR